MLNVICEDNIINKRKSNEHICILYTILCILQHKQCYNILRLNSKEIKQKTNMLTLTIILILTMNTKPQRYTFSYQLYVCNVYIFHKKCCFNITHSPFRSRLLIPFRLLTLVISSGILYKFLFSISIILAFVTYLLRISDFFSQFCVSF